MIGAPGSIDNELHESKKNRKKEQPVLQFPLVLLIAGCHTRAQRQNKEDLAAMPFNRYFCHESLRGVPTLYFIGRRLDLVDNCYNNV